MGLLRGRVPAEAADYAAAAWDRLYPLAWSLTGHRADAEDLVQDTLTTVLTKWEKVAAAESQEAYVRTILVHGFLSRRRRRSSTEVVTDLSDWDPPRPGAGDPTGQLLDRDALWAALRGLAPQQRAVLVLRFFADLPDAAVADLVGCSVGNVRVLAHRALASLRNAESGVPTLQ